MIGFLLLPLLLSLSCLSIAAPSDGVKFNGPMNFVTVADFEHFPWLNGLFKSIREHNRQNKIQILVIDIGMTDEQKNVLAHKEQVSVIPLNLIHPDLVTKFVVRDANPPARPQPRLARGWYAWKPVAMRQALDVFDYFIYIDAGKRITRPSDAVFLHIKQYGYFLMDTGHPIAPTVTKTVLNHFNLAHNDPLLNKQSIEAGFQGISKTILKNYIEPMVELAEDLECFKDDGTAPWGFGGCRHDQTLFSIFAHKNGFNIYTSGDVIRLKERDLLYKIAYVSGKVMEENPFIVQYNII